MSRKRNRNVTSKWTACPQVLKYGPDAVNIFGGRVSPIIGKKFEPLRRTRENTNFYRQVSSFGSSSSSSLSGNEDFEAEATKKVETELQRMNRVLKGIEPIPDHYNKEEYLEWMVTFPNISLWEEETVEPIKNLQENSKRSQSNERNNALVVNGHGYNSLPFNISNHVRQKDRFGKMKASEERKEPISRLHSIKVKTFSNLNDRPQEIDLNREIEKVRALSRSEAMSSRWMKKKRDDEDEVEDFLPQIFSSSASVLSARTSTRKHTGILGKEANKAHSVILPPIKRTDNRRLSSRYIQPNSPPQTYSRKRFSGKSTTSSTGRNSSTTVRWKREESSNGDWFY